MINDDVFGRFETSTQTVYASERYADSTVPLNDILNEIIGNMRILNAAAEI